MEIFPIACESMGVRSFAHVVRTSDVTILIDPSVALAPKRYGLPPHPQEIAASWMSRKVILDIASKADVIIQTHYHADHYSMGITRVYEFTNAEVFNSIYHPEVIILAKDINSHINYRQKRRAYWLWKRKELDIHIADDNSFTFGSTNIVFSPAVPHGEDTTRGWVVEVFIEADNKAYLYTSDVTGPASLESLQFIKEHAPDILVVDGPVAYHPKASKEDLDMAFKYLKEACEISSQVYIDHHFLRSADWSQFLREHLGYILRPFSEIKSIPPLLLEANRKTLHKDIPPPAEFYDTFLANPSIYDNYFHQLVSTFPSSSYWKGLSRLF